MLAFAAPRDRGTLARCACLLALARDVQTTGRARPVARVAADLGALVVQRRWQRGTWRSRVHGGQCGRRSMRQALWPRSVRTGTPVPDFATLDAWTGRDRFQPVFRSIADPYNLLVTGGRDGGRAAAARAARQSEQGRPARRLGFLPSVTPRCARCRQDGAQEFYLCRPLTRNSEFSARLCVVCMGSFSIASSSWRPSLHTGMRCASGRRADRVLLGLASGPQWGSRPTAYASGAASTSSASCVASRRTTAGRCCGA